MGDSILPVFLLFAGLGAGFLLAYLLWGRSLRLLQDQMSAAQNAQHAMRADLEQARQVQQDLQNRLETQQADLLDRRERHARAEAQMDAYRREADEARPYIERSAELTANLAALTAELEAVRREADEARPFVLRASALEAELAALTTARAERQRAFDEAIAERDRVHNQQLSAMRQEFQRLASEALERAQKQFTEQAAQTLHFHRSEATRGLSENRAALAELVKPMHETLHRYGDELKQLERKREQAYGSLSEQLQSVAIGQQAVKDEAGKIVAALRASAKASGAWGEAQLRNVLEMAGLREGVDFTLQASTTDAEGKRRRPDAILHMPGGRQLIVDSKCSLGDYLAASEAQTEQDRTAALRRYAANVRTHAKGLAERAYWKEFAESADFVVMFLPGENFLSAALEQDLDLLRWALDQRILLAGPTNLLALARVVAMVWRQEKMAEEYRAVGKLGADLYESLATMTGHIVRLGKNLSEATGSYNEFIASLEGRVLPRARKFPDLGVETGKKAMADLTAIDRNVREVQSPELRNGVKTARSQSRLQNLSQAMAQNPPLAQPAADLADLVDTARPAEMENPGAEPLSPSEAHV